MYQYNDGGREQAGYKGKTGDCVTRAIAIATGLPYQQVYTDLTALSIIHKQTRNDYIAKRMRTAKSGTKASSSVRYGVAKVVFGKYLQALGWQWVPTMFIGQGCKVHLRTDELPKGNLICRLSNHVVAVIDGVVHDTYDPTRGGDRCVYGYWRREKP